MYRHCLDHSGHYMSAQFARERSQMLHRLIKIAGKFNEQQTYVLTATVALRR